jgi:hypothetical protein
MAMVPIPTSLGWLTAGCTQLGEPDRGPRVTGGLYLSLQGGNVDNKRSPVEWRGWRS